MVHYWYTVEYGSVTVYVSEKRYKTHKTCVNAAIKRANNLKCTKVTIKREYTDQTEVLTI